MVLKCLLRVRSLLLQGLILLIFISGCGTTASNEPVVTIEWQDSIPTGLIIQRSVGPSQPADRVISMLEVHLANDSSDVPLLGEWIASRDAVTFIPLIPLTRSLIYEVRFQGKTVSNIRIPSADRSVTTKVVAVYPTQDTLPENLLKFYIQFSKPMWEADPLSSVYLLRNGVDTVEAAFLDLRPPLWDREGKLLTLWLDPGRIKRDLKPNQTLGAPLAKGNTYKLVLTNRWRAANGEPLKEIYSRQFFVRERDGSSPAPERWKVTTPSSGSSDSLRIEFNEGLDFLLLQESIHVVDERAGDVSGTIHPAPAETGLAFVPASSWRAGRYQIKVESRLEDLAGNNLNKLFDEDLTIQRTRVPREIYSIPFEVK